MLALLIARFYSLMFYTARKYVSMTYSNFIYASSSGQNVITIIKTWSWKLDFIQFAWETRVYSVWANH